MPPFAHDYAKFLEVCMDLINERRAGTNTLLAYSVCRQNALLLLRLDSSRGFITTRQGIADRFRHVLNYVYRPEED